jgi:hypothetical protein
LENTKEKKKTKNRATVRKTGVKLPTVADKFHVGITSLYTTSAKIQTAKKPFKIGGFMGVLRYLLVLTLSGLANRHFQPLSHLSKPNSGQPANAGRDQPGPGCLHPHPIPSSSISLACIAAESTPKATAQRRAAGTGGAGHNSSLAQEEFSPAFRNASD